MDWYTIIVGGIGVIALLVAWGWLAWAWMHGKHINGRFFPPEALKVETIAGAGAAFWSQPRSLVELAENCTEGLVHAVLAAFWASETAMGAALAHGSEKLMGIVKRHFGLSDEWLEKFLSPLKAHFTLPDPGPDVT